MSDDMPDISLPLVIIDVLPVIFFTLCMLLIAHKLKSYHKVGGILFYIGGIIVFIGGLCQVIAKFLIYFYSINITALRLQKRYTFSSGFTIAIIAVIIAYKKIQWKRAITVVLSMPSIIFVVILIILTIAMIVFIFTLDFQKNTTHWIEEVTNAVYQGTAFLCAYFGTRPRNKKNEQEQESPSEVEVEEVKIDK